MLAWNLGVRREEIQHRGWAAPETACEEERQLTSRGCCGVDGAREHLESIL